MGNFVGLGVERGIAAGIGQYQGIGLERASLRQCHRVFQRQSLATGIHRAQGSEVGDFAADWTLLRKQAGCERDQNRRAAHGGHGPAEHLQVVVPLEMPMYRLLAVMSLSMHHWLATPPLIFRMV